MAGSRVCVFERCSVAGGACLTEEFHRGFRFSITTYSVSLLQPFISARKIPFPGDGDWWLAETRGSNLELMGGEAKHLVLLGPCGGQVGEAGNAHAMRKSTVNRRFDEIGREERKQDRHINFADAAPLAFRNCLGGGYPVSCQFIEPTASAGN